MHFYFPGSRHLSIKERRLLFCLKSLLKPEIADLDDAIPSPEAVPQP